MCNLYDYGCDCLSCQDESDGWDTEDPWRPDSDESDFYQLSQWEPTEADWYFLVEDVP